MPEPSQRYDATSSEFDFEAGDRVLVRVREHGDSGTIEGKFEATVDGFDSGMSSVSSDRAVFDPPWESMGGVKLRYYEAEFEVLDDAE